MNKSENSIIKNFSKGAKEYDRHSQIQKAVFDAFFFDSFFEVVKELDPRTILDIGCGTGQFTKQIVDILPKSTIVAFDLSKGMVKKAKKNYPHSRITFLHGDANDFSLQRKFDLIISNATFQWVQQLDKALENIVAHLAEDGHVLLSVFGPRTFHEYQCVLSECFKIKIPLLASSFRPKNVFEAHITRYFKNVEIIEKQIKINYSSLDKLHKSIDNTAGAQSTEGWTVDLLERVENIFLEKYGKISVTADVFFVSAKNPYKENPLIIPINKNFESDVPADSTQEDLQSPTYIKLKQKVTDIFFDACASVLEKPASSFRLDVAMKSCGFCSIAYAQLAGHLNKSLDISISPVFFYEHHHFESAIDDLTKLKWENSKQNIKLNNNNDCVADAKTPEIVQLPEEPNKKSKKPQKQNKEIIAIIGIAGQLPQSKNLDQFWEHLQNGEDLITEIPPDRWDWKKYHGDPAKETNKINSKWGGFIDDIDKFDAAFFGISPREAELMDPQQRLLLETTWKTIEDAGYKVSDLEGSQTGVFIGVATQDYYELLNRNNMSIEAYTSTGTHTSIIANRLSYILNFHGPSEPIDTACSSSLVAIHRAVKAIADGECDLAIAGGVNALLTTTLYMSFSKAGMLCSDGRCKTFSDKANGYVRSEGVGTVLLKSFDQAVADGDHIYGIVKATAENHGGRTNSLTAPNPKAQAKLLEKVYKKADINPSTIGYIECHGTGTELGDPIEIEGLKRAFSKLYKKQGQSISDKRLCGLGSVKSNIGHLEAAAGIAGVFKILLAMKHKEIPKSLHCATVNPYIDLQESPFYIVQEKQPWERFRDKKNKEIPLIAGVSSFGFGGSNAHVVIEEYIPDVPDISIDPQQPVMVILSAKNNNQLRLYAEDLCSFLEKQSSVSLTDLAYTLQIGRESMKERFGVVVSSLPDLHKKLSQFIKNPQQSNAEIYYGQAKRNKEAIDTGMSDSELKNIITKWGKQNEYTKILDLWVKGLDFDWQQLYQGAKPKRISLPTYPFARERYWIPESMQRKDINVLNRLHPLVHENISNLSQQCFSSIFSGSEFFLRDHIIEIDSRAKKVLPGVVYLEMANVAVKIALCNPNKIIRLKNVVWARPIIAKTQHTEINIALFPENEEIGYEIYTVDNNQLLVHNQGIASFVELEQLPTLDISQWKEQCQNYKLSGKNCYQMFDKMGFQYGKSHQAIKKVYLGENKLLVKLSLPETVLETRHQFTIHPSMLDAALQATLVAGISPNELPKPRVPFALDELEILQSCSDKMWAVIRYQNSDASSNVHKFDIDVCDDNGNICLKLKGFSTRSLQSPVVESNHIAMSPRWKPCTLQEIEYSEHHIIAVELQELADKLLADQNCKITSLHSTNSNYAQKFCDSGEQVLEYIKAITQQNINKRVFLQVVIPQDNETTSLKGLSGLLKTAQLENTKLTTQLVEVEKNTFVDVEKIKYCKNYLDDVIRYHNNTFETPTWQELPSQNISMPWKQRGVYLITGGFGGLGIIFARDIVAKAKNSIVILVGRSALNSQQQAILEKLQINDAKVIYEQVDITALQKVISLLKNIQQIYGTLTGILHCAGILRDNFINNKTSQEFTTVLQTKVAGTIHLDEASKNMNLEFLVLFSSLAAVMGNIGQCDYATANAFMDNYALYRNTLVSKGQRSGKTLAINWPLWQEGGMEINKTTETMLQQQWGMIPMQTSTGLKCFYDALESSESQVLVMEGNISRIRQKLLAPKKNQNQEITSHVVSIDEKQVYNALTLMVSKLLKVKIEDIEWDIDFSEYGFDSITLTDFANELNNDYQIELMPTIFFECTNIQSLVDYLIKEHRNVLTAYFGKQNVATTLEVSGKVVEVTKPSPQIPIPNIRSHSRFVVSDVQNKRSEEPDDSIAIIGISCKFPQAKNSEEFWKVLQQGKDCISEIPLDRWDWKALYGDPLKEIDKSNVKWGGFIDDVATFDPLFFGISPREAELMDPQQRLLMMYTWLAMEDAGYSAQSLSGKSVGVFVGTVNSGYDHLLAQVGVPTEGYSSTGIVPSMGPNRMSYFLNIHGPSEPIETACSSSLVAIHRAVLAIKNGSCDMAFVGGVNTIVNSKRHISFNKAGMLSLDGRCKTFSAQANGYVRGEGVGIALLKKLSAAEADNDQIYGIIKSTAENHGGRASSLTAPNPIAQQALLNQAYSKAGIDPRSISYIEAHGTGTELGDPIEINGLKAAFKDLYKSTGTSDMPEMHCGLGSVKTNIGHLEVAAGIAGVIKVLLQLKHKTLVKTLHCEEINPYIKLENSPFYIVQQQKPWNHLKDNTGKEFPRRAGISSFSFGGSNAHVVIEEYSPKQHTINNGKQPQIFVLSAKNNNVLKKYAQRVLDFTKKHSAVDFVSLIYTLQVGRDAMEERFGMVVASLDELQQQLQKFIEDETTATYRGRAKSNKELLAIFSDEECQEMIEKWIDQRKFSKVLELWIKGICFDWNKLYNTNKPQRISLPCYPFSLERYWVPQATEQIPIQLSLSPSKNDNQTSWDGVSYIYQWQIQEASPKNYFSKTVAIVHYGDCYEFENTIANYYQKNNVETVLQIQLSTTTQKLSKNKWLCDIHDIYGFSKCLPKTIDSCYFVGSSQQQNQELQLLRLLKSLKQKQINNNIHFYIITVNNYQITGNPSFYSAGLTGLAYSIAQGDHRFLTRNIDIDMKDLQQKQQHDILIHNIAQQGFSNQGEVVKLTQNHCYKQTFVKLNTQNIEKSGLQNNGVYVILGGSGTLGNVVSHYLIQKYDAQIVWIGRKPESAREIQQKMQKFANNRPYYIEADVTNVDSMQLAVSKIKEKFTKISGAIFCGLIFDFENSIDQTTEQQFSEIFDVKAKGSNVFYSVLKNENLDFMCYFSSAQSFSFSGAAKLCAYAAGITYSDAFVQSIQEESVFPVGTIHWGFWKSSLKNSNISAASLEDKEGFRCFEKFSYLLKNNILSHMICLKASEPIAKLMNCPDEPISIYGEKISSNDNSQIVRQKVTLPVEKSAQVHQKIATSTIAKSAFNIKDYVTETVFTILARTLKIAEEHINKDTAFSELGIDSIVAVSFINDINEHFSIALSTAVIFDYTNINELSTYIAKTYHEEIQQESMMGYSLPLENDTYSSSSSSTIVELPKTIDVPIRTQVHYTKSSEIAVVGISGQFPDAQDIYAFWNNLVTKHDAVHELPPRYLNKDYFDSEKQAGKTYCKWGGILKDRDCFDPLFFNIAPREAESMNPHQRLILQESWRALEDAGYNPKNLANSPVAMYIGAEPTNYFNESFTGFSDAIVASRLSYFLNFSGTALVVNTGCSSSGVAIHLACESLRNCESNIALAGGVFASLDQKTLIRLCDIEMLSPTGKSHTFDSAGDGTVLSEGIGVVVLKRLDDAIAANDCIYGVIQGSGVNQDGASNGITAPSGIAQENLITEVYQKYQINPEDISYIEAHGTGTKLGDPVEANALIRAFKNFTDKKSYCAIGSAKSHIGHTAASAGVIGLIKVLLSLQYKQIPELLNFKQLNPLINLNGTPFYINTKIQKWQNNGKPLMAALNCFGHSGTNVHMVIREYQQMQKLYNVTSHPVFVPLSAKTPESLKEYAQKLLLFLQDSVKTDVAELAYTLQVGREQMKYRAVFIVNSLSKLTSELQSFIANQTSQHSKGEVELKDNLLNDEDTKEMLQKWIAKGKYKKIAELWCQGFLIDWNLLYKETTPKRTHLPTYCFAKEHYWIAESNNIKSNASQLTANILHPLLHSNTSNLSQQRYTTTITGQEFFVEDHVIIIDNHPCKIMPGVAYLEMARAAIVDATEQEQGNNIVLENVVWISPIVLDREPQQVYITLSPQENQILFEIYTSSNNDEVTMHCQGTAKFTDLPKQSINLLALQEQCDKGVMLAQECYEIFSQMGLEYGESFQGIQQICAGNRQVIARVSLPSVLNNTLQQFVLHPSILDSALQTAIGAVPSISQNPLLPFSLDEIQVHSSCGHTAIVWIRCCGEKISGIEKLDVDICDQDGNVCVALRGFSMRYLENTPKVEKHIVTPIWDVLPVESLQRDVTISDPTVVVGGTVAQQKAITSIYPKAQIIEISGEDTNTSQLQLLENIKHLVCIADNFEDDLIVQQSLLQTFRIIKALLELEYGEQEITITCITTLAQSVAQEQINPNHAGIHGLLGSLAKEYPHWNIRLFDISKDSAPFDDIFCVETEKCGNALVHRNGEWYRQKLIPLQDFTTNSLVYRKQGIYVVIGGAGGIGVAWSQFMMENYQAQIIWIGRREKNATIQQKIDSLATLGCAPYYICADATQYHSLQAAYYEIKREFNQIHGVIHAAIILKDQSLAKMDEQTFRESLAAKVDTSVHMAQIFSQESLDFIIFFSSIMSFTRMAGQSNYAAGSTFQDTFAHKLAQQVDFPVKIINWGYWGSVGIVKSPEYQQRMADVGLASIEPSEGMQALSILLENPINQIALIKTTKSQVVEIIDTEQCVSIQPPNSIISTCNIKDYLTNTELEIKPGEGLQNQQIQQILHKILFVHLQNLGLFSEKVFSLKQLKQKINWNNLYDRWFEESLKFLQRARYLKASGENYMLSASMEMHLDKEWQIWHNNKQKWLQDPQLKALVILLEEVLKVLPDILLGKTPATDILFPNSSFDLVEGIYRDNPICDYLNQIVGDVVVAHLKNSIAKNSQCCLRILEIGAGTGGTTTKVLPKLQHFQQNISEYCYTDLSQAFLLHARNQYAPQNPYLKTAILDIEKPLKNQNIEIGSYDLVIATNVLHATQNIRETLRNVKAILATGGILIINEMVENTIFAHLTFGLLKGWWLYNDPAIRIPGSPALSPSTWKKILHQEGLLNAFCPHEICPNLGQQIIISKSNGIMRQNSQIKSGTFGEIKSGTFDTFDKIKSDTKQNLQIKSGTFDKIKSGTKQNSQIKSDTFGEIKSGTKQNLQIKSDTFDKIKSGTFDTFDKIKSGTKQKIKSGTKQNSQIKSGTFDKIKSDTFDENILRTKTTEYIKELIGETLRIPSFKIDAAVTLENYGIDSILIVQLTNTVNKVFTGVKSTIFFEYQTVNELVEYFIEKYRDTLLKLIKVEMPEQVEKFDSLDTSKKEVSVKVVTGNITKLCRSRFMVLTKNNSKLQAHPQNQDIAIIGLAGRYPMAENLEMFWDNLQHGKNCISEIPQDRWDWKQYFAEEKGEKGKMYSKWGGFLNEIDKFDPLFFHISPRDAEQMDPQERLFLETAYQCIEDAGYTPFGLCSSRKVGVFVGVMNSTYRRQSSHASIANRISYTFDFHGPSMAIDTACSSSLTAIHLAIESLRSGSSECAIAGGVNLIIDPIHYIGLSSMTMLSPSNKCKSFGKEADGFVDGEGVGAIILKPLSQAIVDRDHIYGVVKGSMINAGGKTNGYTVPNPKAQSEVVAKALEHSKINARNISYVEAHGTGTKLGDPIEIVGLAKAFAKDTDDKQFCAIGSAKSNIGHCESAAGIAGITKILLQLKHKMLAPSLHAETPNPDIDFSQTPFTVNQKLSDWKKPIVCGKECSRIAGISSFGAGGANAHIVIEEYEAEVKYPSRNEDETAVVILSAKSYEQLQRYAKKILDFVCKEQSSISLKGIAYTLQVGREAMEKRLGIIAHSVADLQSKLEKFIEHGEGDDIYLGEIQPHQKDSIFDADEDLTHTVNAWIQKKKYHKLLGLWLKGFELDWKQFYKNDLPYRMSLPTYPFAKNRFWKPETEIFPSENSNSEKRTICFLKKNWKQLSISPCKPTSEKVAILTTNISENLSLKIAEHFCNHKIINIEKLDVNIDVFFDNWKEYNGCIDLTGISANRDSLVWVRWLQLLLGYGNRENLILLGVTKGLESYQNPSNKCYGALQASLYRMLQSEYSSLYSRHVDLDPTDSETLFVKQIISEFGYNCQSTEVCYRKGLRYTSFLEETTPLQIKSEYQFPQNSALWITGGTRGLGYLCARHFVRKYNVKRLVLSGREIFPPRSEWSMAVAQNNSMATKIKNILELERQGIQVEVLSVDLTNLPELKKSIFEIENSLGQISGIVHCAGLGEQRNPAFIRKSIDSIESVLSPKITGLQNLYECFGNSSLDFFVLFSSVSAIIPSLAAGHSDYAMANAYMDYFSEAYKKLPFISIQWPNWKSTGMGEIKNKIYEATGLLNLSDQEGLDLLDKVLFCKDKVILPSIVDNNNWNPQVLLQSPMKVVVQRVKENNTLQKILQETQNWLLQLFSKELQITTTKMNICTPFSHYGADSILLAQILKEINENLAIELDPSILYDYETIQSFSKWLLNTQKEKVVEYLTSNTLGIQQQETTPEIIEQKVDIVNDKQNFIEVKNDYKNNSDIAVIGMSCRFPGANSIEEYWSLLSEGKSSIDFVPKERWGYKTHYSAGLLDEINLFDPQFFLIPQEDARAMDPQALIVLEESLKLLCNAGYTQQQIQGHATGVYLGARSQHRPNKVALEQAINPIVTVGQNYLATNISQFFDLRGPSLVIDTACSSALVAMNIAIQDLRNNEINSAIVGGVSLLLDDAAHQLFEQRKILSQSNSFHIFDQRANGVVLGEGVGLVFLKTVDQALQDGDTIHAIIKGLAINNDGRTAGPATPNLEAQKKVMHKALQKAQKKPCDISYIEVNGSGSEVTDLLELKAIESVYRNDNNEICSLGSIKPNIGHPLCAEGIASFIKVVMMLNNKKLVPFLSGEQPLKHYDIQSSPFYFTKQTQPWDSSSHIAAINCFADGGTNAHVILEKTEYPDSYNIKKRAISLPTLQKYNIQNIVKIEPGKRQTDTTKKISTKTKNNFWRQS